MSESHSYRPDQAAPVAPQQQYGEQFAVPKAFKQPAETPESFLADATNDVEQAYQTTSSTDRLVFKDDRSRNFEIRQEQPRPAASTGPNMLDDSYAEMVRARQEAAASQAEHEALDAQNVHAVAVTGKMVHDSREFAEKYGLAA